MKLRTQFILAMLAGVILPVAIVMFISISKFKAEAISSFETQSTSEISQIDRAFSLYLNGLAEDALFLSNTKVIRELDGTVAKYMGKPPAPMTPDQNSPAEVAAFNLMREFGEARPDLAYVYLGLSDGGYIQWPTGNNSDNYDPRKRPWYTSALKQPNQPVRAAAYADMTTGTPLLDYLKVFTARDGLQGVVGVDVTLKKLTEMVKQVKFGQQGYLMLIEDTGVVLADPAIPEHNFKLLAELGESYEKLAKGEGFFELSLNEQTWFASIYHSPELGWKFIGLMPADEVFARVNELQWSIIFVALIMIGVFAALAYLLSQMISKPMSTITHGLQEIASGEGDLTARLAVNGETEAGTMAKAFNSFTKIIHQLIVQIKENAGQLESEAQKARGLSDQVREISEHQKLAIEQLATAFNEMVATANEVAKNCSNTAEAADHSQQQVVRGQEYIGNTSRSVSQLEAAILQSNEAMGHLAQESNNITSILDTIRGIADQTNLLALNAAIEAARAGEQGRGFAVVAEEVRTLAQKTSESTSEIDRLINALMDRTKQVSDKLSSSSELSKHAVENTRQTEQVFNEIQSSVSTISDMATQIAAAAEEQHLVAEDINRNIANVQDQAINAHDASMESFKNAEELDQLAEQLTSNVKRFRT